MATKPTDRELLEQIRASQERMWDVLLMLVTPEQRSAIQKKAVEDLVRRTNAPTRPGPRPIQS